MFSKPTTIAAPLLKQKHLRNCKVVPQRFHLLEKLKKEGVGVEIGVLGGDWSDKLIRFTKPKRLMLIDTFCSNDYPHLKRFSKKTHLNFIENRFESNRDIIDIKQGLSWDCLARVEENTFDWIYIDAAHNYEAVKKDLKQARRTVKDDGCIIMNDYIMYDHFMKEPYGVVRATNEFIIEHDYEMLFLAFHPDMFCDVLIKKRVL